MPGVYNAVIDGIDIGPEVGSCGGAAYRNPSWRDLRGSFALIAMRVNAPKNFETGRIGSRQTGLKRAETRARGSVETGENGEIRPRTVRERARTAPEIRGVRGVGSR